MDPHRGERVSETLKEELEEMIGYEMSDPRIGSVAVTEVLLSPDLKVARVRLSLSEDPEERKQTLQALEGARHYLRRQLAGRVQIYRIPDLHFEADLPGELAGRAKSLLQRVRKGRPRDEENPPHEKNPAE
ncbi:MAG TPA: 30S ribosome-binding factor RbfA [Bryobacteraceae bacterium]|nr:30S ribosome-binding factor RbfA [Bryobacteraceae bacterium]